ncbi:MAG: alginate export family protein [Phycisphaerae bacterium]
MHRNILVGPFTIAFACQVTFAQTVTTQPSTNDEPGTTAAVKADEKGVVDESPPPSQPLPGPKYFDLRYDEDFSYLDGDSGTYREDFFDPIKNIRFGDDWRLSIGGEFRFRMEAETNFAFDAAEPTQDTFQLYRYLTHFDLKYRKSARVFLQLASMHDEDRDRALRPLDENEFAIQQLFFDVRPLGDDTPLVLRLGRQDLSYGAQRFISPLTWANTRRRFDAVKMFWSGEDWQFDVFFAKPVLPIRRSQLDRYNEEFDLYGAYFTYKGIPNHGVDVFFFAQDDTQHRRNPNGNAGDMSRFTLGGRFYGKSNGFDYDAFFAGQWGTWAGDDIEAWAWGIDGGYTFAECALKPRIGAGFDWASGDRDPTDGTVETFDQLFPLGHKYLGFMDFFGRQNIQAANVNVSAWPIPKKVNARLAWLAFWLESDDDAIYNVGGAPGRRDPTGRSGNEIGQEIDFTVLWKIDPHQAMLLGYSHFFDNEFITNTGPSEDADLFYAQYTYTF